MSRLEIVILIAGLVAGAIGLYLWGSAIISAVVSPSNTAPLVMLIGAWLCLISYLPHLKLTAETWRVLDGAVNVTGGILCYAGIVFFLAGGDLGRASRIPQCLCLALALTAGFGMIHLSQFRKQSTARSPEWLTQSRRKRYHVGVVVASMLMMASMADLPDWFRTSVGLAVSVVALYGMRLFWICARPLWSLGLLFVAALYFPGLFQLYISGFAWPLVLALTVIFFAASFLEILRIYPDSDAICPTGLKVFSPSEE